MNSSVPDDLRAFGSTSESMGELIRKQRDTGKLRGLLLEGAASPVEGAFDDACFARLRRRVLDRVRRITKL